MVDVLTEIVIDRSLEQVSRYAANPENAPEWYVKIQSAEWEASGPLQVGSRIAFKAQFLGKTLSYTYEIAEFQPQSRLVMRTAEGPFPMETTYEWEQIGPDRTRMTLRNMGSPSGFSRLMAPFMKRAMRRANEKDLNLLKSILEGN